MPPLPYVLEGIFNKFLPVAGSAALLYALVTFLFGPRFRTVAAWLAVVGSWCVTNLTFNSWEGKFLAWLPWSERDPTMHWLPWVAMAAMTVGAVAEMAIPWLVRLILFGLLAGTSAWVLTPEMLRQKEWWIVPAIAGVAGLNAFVSWAVARRQPGGLIPMTHSIALMGCAGVLIYANTGKLMDVSMAFGSGLFGVALLAALTKTDAGAATAAMGVLLPGLMLIGLHRTYSDLPMDAFIAAGVAPTAMGLSLLLPASRLSWLFAIGALAIPVGWAMMRAMQFGSLAV